MAAFSRPVDHLRGEVERMRREWCELQILMSGGLFHQPIVSQRVSRAGAFQLERFRTSLDPSQENHIGEAIVRENGTLEYLKSFRLSAAQVRRAFLLEQLSRHHRNLDDRKRPQWDEE